MDVVSLAKRRSRRRQRDAGAVMFVVSMTIAVLAAVGVYALAAAATEVKTSGNERQSTQTHYLAEYGIVAAAHEIVATKAQAYVDFATNAPNPNCLSLPGVPLAKGSPTSACLRLGSADLGSQWAGAPGSIVIPYAGNTPFQATKLPGSLGATPMNGDFFIELTEPTQAKVPPGYGLGLDFYFIQMTVSAAGITQPLYPWQASATLASTVAGQGIEMQRARIIAGPVQRAPTK